MTGQKQATRPTPVGVTILDQTWRGRVTYMPLQQFVIMRVVRDGVHEVLDVSRPFADLMRAKWVRIGPFDIECPPAEVRCLLTPGGEDVLMEETKGKRKEGKK